MDIGSKRALRPARSIVSNSGQSKHATGKGEFCKRRSYMRDKGPPEGNSARG